MDTQEKRVISVRLDPELVAWITEYGRERRWDRTTVITAALEALRDDASRGVPGAPAVVSTASPRVADVRQEVARKPVPEGVVRARELPPVEFTGCREHPEAGAVRSRGGMWCAEPGCPAPAGTRRGS